MKTAKGRAHPFLCEKTKEPVEPNQPTPFMADSDGAEQARGQIAEYAATVMRVQRRQFLFMIVIIGRCARILRWDRVGAVVSEPINFVADPRSMFRFLFKYGNMKDGERGYDPTAELASPSDIEQMKTCKPQLSKRHQAYLDDMLSGGWLLYKIRIPASDIIRPEDLKSMKAKSATVSASESPATLELDEGSPSSEPRYFVIGKPRYASNSPTGRSTGAFVAYDLARDQLVFYKDTWRWEDSRTEGEVYKHLHRRGVRQIATPVAEGDVRLEDGTVQRTRTQGFFAPPKAQARVHYRLICEEVGRPLESYQTVKEMLHVILGALIGTRLFALF